MRNALQATFWIADGVMLRNDIAVPNPPPPTFVMSVMPSDFSFMLRDFSSPLDVVRPHTVYFRRAEWSESGDIVHYNLDSPAPKGFRWIVVGKEIRSERIKKTVHA